MSKAKIKQPEKIQRMVNLRSNVKDALDKELELANELRAMDGNSKLDRSDVIMIALKKITPEDYRNNAF